MATGTVKWMNYKKGFGFIIPNGGGMDLFVHISGIESNDPLKDGQAVSYEIGYDRNNRENAINVKPL